MLVAFANLVAALMYLCAINPTSWAVLLRGLEMEVQQQQLRSHVGSTKCQSKGTS